MFVKLLPNHSPSHAHQNGQIAVIILLLMVVLMTIGLSLATRTTQDIFLSQQEAESARVFNAAEVGVEEALTQDFSTITETQTFQPSTVIDDTTISYDIFPSNTFETLVREGQHAEVDLTGVIGNSLTIRWGEETGCGAGSLIASIYYDDSGDLKARHSAIAPQGCVRGVGDGFDQGTPAPGSSAFANQYNLNIVASDDLFIRIRSVYDDSRVEVTGNNLPVQQHTIRSTALNDLGNEQKSIQVQRSLETAPGFMDYAVYSGGSITKN